jgi:hypothetical protein
MKSHFLVDYQKETFIYSLQFRGRIFSESSGFFCFIDSFICYFEGGREKRKKFSPLKKIENELATHNRERSADDIKRLEL